MVIGHELVHVYLFNRSGNAIPSEYHEAVAYKWAERQASVWGLNKMASEMKWMVSSGKKNGGGNGKHDSFSHPVPIRTSRPQLPMVR